MRTFMAWAPAVALAGAVALVPGCGTDGEGSTTYTSSVDSGHSHTLTLDDDDLSGGAVERRTSTDSGHSHLVSLSEAEVDALAGGGRVQVATSQDAGHTHAFDLGG